LWVWKVKSREEGNNLSALGWHHHQLVTDGIQAGWKWICPCKSTSKDSVPTHQTEIIPGKTRGGGSPVQDEDGDDNDLSTTWGPSEFEESKANLERKEEIQKLIIINSSWEFFACFAVNPPCR
jgi:hypothetical protein